MEITSHPPGSFCFPELNTHGVEAAKRFYEALFGWSAPEKSLPEVGPYSVARIGERQVAGTSPSPTAPAASPRRARSAPTSTPARTASRGSDASP